MVENQQKKLVDRLASEPSYRLVLYKMLRFCETARLATEIEAEVQAFPEMKTAVLSPGVLLSWLEHSGGVERIGEKQAEQWQITDAGKQALALEAPSKRLFDLIAKEPEYGDLFRQTLGFCQTPRTRGEIEEWVKQNPVAQASQVHPAFLLQRLEDAGGIEWANNHWQLTDAGKGVAQ
jgi:hypothetical protein